MSEHTREGFLDLNVFRGLGEDPVWHPPELADRPRDWPLEKWAEAPRDLGYPDFARYQWRGVRLLKDPDTQAAYHDLLCELRPRTVIELGVFSGGSLMWFRDMADLLGLDCQVIGIDRDLSRCQLPENEMKNISLREADCADLATFEQLRDLPHPLVFIDDAHANTFNILRWTVDNLLEASDYFIIEDMIPYWYRYAPKLLTEYLAAFQDELSLDMVYANASAQLDRGVLRRLPKA